MKVAIIGSGRVGSAIAFALLHRKSVNEIILIDKNKKILEGEATDLGHASHILRGRNIVRKGSYRDVKPGHVVIIAAGRARTRETDKQLYRINRPSIDKIAAMLRKQKVKKENIYLVTNPVEILSEEHGLVHCGELLDETRKRTDGKSGRYILKKKKFTNWGIAAEVEKRIK